MNTVIKTLNLALSITLVSTSIIVPAEPERKGSFCEIEMLLPPLEPMLLPPPALAYTLPTYVGSLVRDNCGNSLSPNTTPQRTPAVTPHRTPQKAHLNQLQRIPSQVRLGWVKKTDPNGKQAWYSKDGVRRESISDLPNNYVLPRSPSSPVDRSYVEKLASLFRCCCK